MIFVTVGTHEQPMNRLVEYMDKWAERYDEDVVVQTGYSTHEPKNCRWCKLFPYSQMLENVYKARIVITHGGPSSFMMPLQIGKVPIVVPRKKEYNEHVNNHQVDFSKAVAERQGNIIVVEDIEELSSVIDGYENLVKRMANGFKKNNEKFCSEFGNIVDEMVRTKRWRKY